MTQVESEPTVGTAGPSLGRIVFATLGGAIAWSLHFLGNYALLAIGCVARWGATIPVLVVMTLLLTGVACWSTAVAWREWHRTGRGMPWDRALSEPPGWYAWLMTVGILMGITAIFTILLEGLGTLMLPVCGWDVR